MDADRTPHDADQDLDQDPDHHTDQEPVQDPVPISLPSSDPLELRMMSLSGLDVPPEPAIEDLPVRSERWRPALVAAAAAVLLLVGGAVAVGNRASSSDVNVGVSASPTIADGGRSAEVSAPPSEPPIAAGEGPEGTEAPGTTMTAFPDEPPGVTWPTTAPQTTASTRPGITTTTGGLGPTNPSNPPSTTVIEPETTTTTRPIGGPVPDVQVIAGSTTLDLTPWTTCWQMLCADGMPPANPESIGSPDEVLVRFLTDGWTFQATFVPAGSPTSQGTMVPLSVVGATDHRLIPTVAPGTYHVHLFGQSGPGASERGDVSATFLWIVA